MRATCRALVCLCLSLVVVPERAVAQAPPIPRRLALADAVALAAQRNPAIAEARARVEAADADVVVASRRPNPAVTSESQGRQELTLRIDQEWEAAGRRALRTSAAGLGRDAAQSALAEASRQVSLAVQRAYLSAVLAHADRTVAQTALEEIDRVIALNRARLAQGEISGADLRRLQVERLRFVEDVFAAELAVKNGHAELLVLLNAPSLDQPIELTDGLAVAPPEMAPLLDVAQGIATMPALLDRAATRRPDLLGAQQTLMQADTLTRVQRALRTPAVSVGAGYRRTDGRNTVVVGATIPLPLFNRNQGGVLRADAERRAADARVAATHALVRLDVQRAFNAAETNRARVAYLEREYLTAARESRDIVLESYRLGVANLIDYLDAQRAFRDTQRIYNRALFDQRLSLFELSAAIGSPDGRE